MQDNEQRATFTRFSSEYDGPRTYYVDTGEEVPIRFVESNENAKPLYDIEVGGKKWSFNFTFDLYVDVHQRLAHFWFPSYWGGHILIALPVILAHKLCRKVS